MSDYAASNHSPPAQETGKDEMSDCWDDETRSLDYEENDIEQEDDYIPTEEADTESEHEEQDETVREDMRKLQDEEILRGKFRLINRVGEGTFSTVYKAQDLTCNEGAFLADPLDPSKPLRKPKKHYVALKKIYVTSSPARILNELEILHDLRGHPAVCHIKAAFRLDDQVIAVLPYFPHTDFRLMFRTFLVEDMRHYFKSLLEGLAFVHKLGVIHRDIKPTNFLYNPKLRRGVLVDFGLAEYENEDGNCMCSTVGTRALVHKHDQIMDFIRFSKQTPVGYPRNDSRPSRRANRAGTRGFRAPEVLFKCTNQNTKLDVWSVGVILLTFLARRFPFFHSMDDADALIEIASIFGKNKMQLTAAEHGLVFDTTIPTILPKGHSLERIIRWSSSVVELTDREIQAVNLLEKLLEPSALLRWSADGALYHEFFTNPQGADLPWGGEDPANLEHHSDHGDDNDDTACDAGDELQLRRPTGPPMTSWVALLAISVFLPTSFSATPLPTIPIGNGKVQRHLGDRGLCLIGALVATIAIAIGFIGLSNQHLHLPSAFVCESYHAISRYITDCFFDRKPATMAWQCTGRSNFQLIENLFTADLIKSQRVKNAMLKVDRGHYSPSNPYNDSPQSIGFAATISAPHMHAHACEYLLPFLHPGARVLDIGCGSGYLSHVFAELITDAPASDGCVVGIDHIQGLVDLSLKNLAKSEEGRKLLDSGKIKIVKGDGRKGWAEGGPYDAIHVGAAAATMHSELIDQLRAPGRMFIPVDAESTTSVLGSQGQHVWIVDKAEDGSVNKKKVFGVSYVPLTDAPEE
ncbi:CDC7 protein kinase [Trichophyton rubrum]|uniref:protein-L-isoaspartate(D-aspartate) O-methyltransferase n=4 Tax=Trichophyton TaxID=5550 RepID=A0A178F1Q6_TRIRU|nr:CDC7 protein kinase [Trichophyton rubrum]